MNNNLLLVIILPRGVAFVLERGDGGDGGSINTDESSSSVTKLSPRQPRLPESLGVGQRTATRLRLWSNVPGPYTRSTGVTS